MQYKVITQTAGVNDFNHLIEAYLKAGWEPVGACVIIPPEQLHNNWTYFQTLIKKDQ